MCCFSLNDGRAVECLSLNDGRGIKCLDAFISAYWPNVGKVKYNVNLGKIVLMSHEIYDGLLRLT